MFLFASLAVAASPSHPLIERLRAHFDEATPDDCLTGLVAELRDHADELSPSERAWATTKLTPWKADLLDPVAAPASPPPPDATPTQSCFDIGAHEITSEHFAVQWDDGVSEAYAEDFIEWLEEGYDVEVDTYGWEPPLQGDDYLMLAYIADDDRQASAYTTVESCGGGYVPYVVAYSGSFFSSGWAETMAVHEFNHALQYSHGMGWEFWWWEATATYVESLVYPNSGRWWGDYLSGYTEYPYIAMSASNQSDYELFWHTYGMAIWAFYLDEYMGGPDTVLGTWQASDGQGGYYGFGMKDAFEEMGLDFEAAYADFIARNAAMQYADRDAFPTVDESDSVRSLPADGESDRETRPQGYGQNYIRFEAGAGAGDLHVTFDGDEDVDWAVLLVEVDNDTVLRVVQGEVDDGQSDLTMPDFGAHDVVLVVSPLKNNDDPHGYDWDAELVIPPPPVVKDEASEPVACGCESGSGSAGTVGVLLGAVALVRRKRG